MSQDDGSLTVGSHPNAVDTAWKGLYAIGAVAALIAFLLFLVDIVILTSLGPQPTTANGWFTLLENNRVVGLFQLFLTDLFSVTILCPVFLALYAALRRANPALLALATVLAFIGIAIVIATNTGYSMIYLSDRYAAATSELERSQLLAAGEAMAAVANGTGSSVMAALLLETALVIISAVMIGSGVFSKGIGYLGIAAHGLDLARSIIALIVIPLFGLGPATAIAVPLLTVGGSLQLIWYPLVGWRLLRMARSRG